MPNHVHGIIQIVRDDDAIGRDAIHRVSDTDTDTDTNHDAIGDDRDAMNRDAINRVSTGGATGNKNPMVGHDSISAVVRWYKGRVTFETNQTQRDMPFAWQARFHDHVIRSERELNAVRQYIRDNPSNWEHDDQNA